MLSPDDLRRCDFSSPSPTAWKSRCAVVRLTCDLFGFWNAWLWPCLEVARLSKQLGEAKAVPYAAKGDLCSPRHPRVQEAAAQRGDEETSQLRREFDTQMP